MHGDATTLWYVQYLQRVKCHVYEQIRFSMQFMSSVYGWILVLQMLSVASLASVFSTDIVASFSCSVFILILSLILIVEQIFFILFLHPTHFHFKCVYVCNLSHLTMTMMIMDTEP